MYRPAAAPPATGNYSCRDRAQPAQHRCRRQGRSRYARTGWLSTLPFTLKLLKPRRHAFPIPPAKTQPQIYVSMSDLIGLWPPIKAAGRGLKALAYPYRLMGRLRRLAMGRKVGHHGRGGMLALVETEQVPLRLHRVTQRKAHAPPGEARRTAREIVSAPGPAHRTRRHREGPRRRRGESAAPRRARLPEISCSRST